MPTVTVKWNCVFVSVECHREQTTAHRPIVILIGLLSTTSQPYMTYLYIIFKFCSSPVKYFARLFLNGDYPCQKFANLSYQTIRLIIIFVEVYIVYGAHFGNGFVYQPALDQGLCSNTTFGKSFSSVITPPSDGSVY